MHVPSKRRMVLAGVLAIGLGVTIGGTAWASPPSPPSRTLTANTRFYVDPQSEAAHQAVTDLLDRGLVKAGSGLAGRLCDRNQRDAPRREDE